MKYTYYVYIDLTSYEVIPKSTPTYSSELIDDETGAYFHRPKLDSIVLHGADYNLIHDFVESSGCNEAFLDVYASCSDSPIYSGYFSKFDIEMNPDKSICTIKPNINDVYRCIYEGWEKKINLIQYAGYGARLRNFIDYEWYYDDAPPPPSGEGWELIANKPFTYGGSDNFNIYGRQRLSLFYCSGDLTTPPPPDNTWIVLNDATGIQVQYVKGTGDLFNIDHPQDVPNGSYSSQLPGTASTLRYHSTTFETEDFTDSDFTNGIKLEDALHELATQSCDQLFQIKSNFFQINPTDISDDNYVTNDVNRLKNILIFQMSDIRDPQPTNSAIKLEKSLKDLLSDLASLNLRWRVLDDLSTLEIEHISFYNNTSGLDLSTVKGYSSYNMQEEKHPQRTRNLSLYQNKIDWKGVDIVYSGSCTYDETRESSFQFSSDLLGILDNGSLTDGYVWVACGDCEVGTNEFYVLLDQGGITGQMLPNAVLSWANIYKDLYLHNSPLPELNINGEDYSAITVKRIRKQKIKAFNQCFDIDPTLDVTTSLGQGTVVNISTPLATRRAEIELLV